MKDELNAAIAEPGFASRILPQVGSVDAVRELRQICEVIFVTTPHMHSQTWMRERQDWLHRYYDIRHDEIIHAFHKQHVIGDVLVDDRPKTIARWEAKHPKAWALLWDMPYNRKDRGYRRVNSWSKVIELVQALKTEMTPFLGKSYGVDRD